MAFLLKFSQQCVFMYSELRKKVSWEHTCCTIITLNIFNQLLTYHNEYTVSTSVKVRVVFSVLPQSISHFALRSYALLLI